MGRAAYLLKKYNLTAVEYAQMMIEQGGACKCCGAIPKGDYPLHVDHSHKVAAYKIRVDKPFSNFIATVKEFPGQQWFSATREDATILAKKWLLRKSIRGLVCWKCNTVLKWARDSVEILLKCAKYLQEFSDGLSSV